MAHQFTTMKSGIVLGIRGKIAQKVASVKRSCEVESFVNER